MTHGETTVQQVDEETWQQFAEDLDLDERILLEAWFDPEVPKWTTDDPPVPIMSADAARATLAAWRKVKYARHCRWVEQAAREIEAEIAELEALPFVERYLADPDFRAEVGFDPLAAGAPRLRPDANPPADLFEVLCEIEPRFRRSFHRRRPDLPDQSPSAYDFSLCYFAWSAHWTAQQVADLLIASRRVNGQPVAKALRPDYVERTLLRSLLSVVWAGAR